jgi:uncharacterized protein (TIGR03437 family)
VAFPIRLSLVGLGFATADTFLIKSTDGGRTWVDIDPGPPDPFLVWFRVDPQTSAVYALTQSCSGGACSGPEQRLMVSDDGGQTWQTRQTFLRDASLWFSLAATPSGPDTLYLANQVLPGRYPGEVIITRVADAGRQSELYSADGLSIEYEQLPSSSGGYLTGFAADAATPSKLYALITDDYSDDIYAYFQALWTSLDRGRTWKQLQPPVTAHCGYPSIWIDASESSVYLSCGLPNTVDFWKSSDGGGSWTQKATPVGSRIWNLTLGPGSPAILYMVEISGAIWKSTDGAESWQLSGQLPSNCCWTLSVDPTNPAVLFLSGPIFSSSGGPKGIWKSEDGGQTWAMVLASDGYWDIHVDPQAPNTVYAASVSRQQVLLNNRQTFLQSVWGEKQVAPGSLVSIYGLDLAANTQSAGSPPLPFTLSGAMVLIGGQAAPLLYVSPEQINAQVPFGLTGPVRMEVRKNDGSADRQTVTISSRATFVLRENANRQSVPLLFHGSDLRPVTASDPLRAGETLTVLATGMGELTPSLVAGSLPPTPLPQLKTPICFGIQGYSPQWRLPLWAGADSGQIGLYRIDMGIPNTLPAGAYRVDLTDARTANTNSACTPSSGVTLDSVNIEIR